MTNEEVIAQLSKENLELKEKVKDFKLRAKKVHSILYCCGGPLNDNVQKFTVHQLRTFWYIKEAIE
jgi:hypothetical protein